MANKFAIGAFAALILGGATVGVIKFNQQPPVPVPAPAGSSLIYSLGDLTRGTTDSFCYAVIGDYGDGSPGEATTAAMVKTWNPAYIITTGDNDYEADPGTIAYDEHLNIDSVIGKYYGSYINKSLATNRFFPCLGNHDDAPASMQQKYFAYFPFLKNAQNYDFIWGPIHFYSINSGGGKKSNIDPNVLTALRQQCSAAPEALHIVFFHHPQYASAGSVNTPLSNHLAGDSIDVVLNGHVHYYERFTDPVRNIRYITIGNSGRENNTCGSMSTFDSGITRDTCQGNQNGAVKVTVVKTGNAGGKDHWRMTFEYYNVATPGSPSDVLMVNK